MPVSSASFVRTTVALLAAGFLALLGIVVTALWLSARTDTFAEQLAEVLSIRRETFMVLGLAQDAETGQRGYLLTRDPAYLEPYRSSVAEIGAQMQELRRATQARPDFAAEMDRLGSAIDAKLTDLGRTVDLAERGRFDQAIALVRADSDRRAMDGIRAASGRIIEASNGLIDRSTAELRFTVRVLTLVLAAGGLVIALVVGGSAWVAWRYTRELEAARGEVEALNVGLEERVRERTADLARANEEVQRFAYIVSHDLRSPLVNIMGFTSELEVGLSAIQAHLARTPANDDDPAEREARAAASTDMPEAIGFIRTSTAKMDNLINAILKLSREGRRTLQPRPVDMNALLETAASTVRHQLNENGGDILIDGHVPALVSDKLALEQVFGNLIDNAVKYLDPQRPGRIVIRGRELPVGVEYEVEDNGRGIAPEDHERIFELFRRAGRQDKAGEGIGLSHVKALVRRLGGEITLESQLGKGTTFRVRLPRNLPLLRESA